MKNFVKKTKKEGLAGFLPFFEILNEAIAYHFLIREGCKNIRFIKVSSSKTPDLEISENNKIVGLAEVKTIRYSLDELAAVEKELRTGDGRFLEMNTHNALRKKIKDHISKAIDQLWAHNSSSDIFRKIYLFLNLDSGIELDLIFIPDNEFAKFIFSLKEELKAGHFPNREGKKVELRCFDASGHKPIEIPIKNN